MIPIPACLRDLESWILKAASLPSISIHLPKMAALPNPVNTWLPNDSIVVSAGSTGAQDAEEHTCPVAPVDRSGGQQKYQEADGVRYPERSGIWWDMPGYWDVRVGSRGCSCAVRGFRKMRESVPKMANGFKKAHRISEESWWGQCWIKRPHQLMS